MVPAAGAGSRLGGPVPKQYQRIAGATVLGWSLRAILSVPDLRGIAVALDSKDARWRQVPECHDARVVTCVGGAERPDSVLAALARIVELGAAPTDRVLVHDAARPAVSAAAIERLLEYAQGPDGGLLALPVGDTVKRGDADARVACTVSRDGLWTAQTPQCFPVGALAAALEQARRDGLVVTDDASAMEHAGARPRLVRGEATNLKLTHAADFALLAAVLGLRGSPAETAGRAPSELKG